MDKKQMKRLQAISHRVHKDRTELASEFLSTLKQKLAERKYRADLSLVTASKNTQGTFHAEVKFHPSLGVPSEDDILTLCAQYSNHDIAWDMVEVDPEAGVILLTLEPSTEVIPISSVKEIPSDFVALGSGIFKRRASATVNEIWTLKKGDQGLALYRNPHDFELEATDDVVFKAGDVVQTPSGVGRIKRFDDMGNAFIQIGSKIHLVGQSEMVPYSIDKDKAKLESYFSEIYGPDMGKALVKDYSDRGKKGK